MQLNAFDFFFLTLTIISVSAGAKRGFIFESINVLGWIVSFFLALKVSPHLIPLLDYDIIPPASRAALSMGIIFIAGLFIFSLFATLGRKSVNTLGMRSADRFVGAGFGFLRVMVLGVTICVIINALQWQQVTWWQNSQIAAPVFNAAQIKLAQNFPHSTLLQNNRPTPEQRQFLSNNEDL